MRRLRLQVDRGDVGTRVDRFVAARRRSLSRTTVVRWIEEGRVRVDGAVVARPSARLVREGEVSVDVPAAEGEAPLVLDDARVLALDGDVLVLDKPAGYPVRARLSLGGADVLAAARALLAARGLDPTLRPAHRLDKDTSGVLLFARTRDAARTLHRAFVEGKVRKTYAAVLRAPPPRTSGVVDLPLLAVAGELPRADPSGRPASTRWRVAKGPLVLFRPRTGRTHQLRIHAARLGCPIVGERIHAPAVRGEGRLLLHALRLRFPHPSGGAAVVAKARLPFAMQP